MALIERLMHLEEPGISVHAFFAAQVEVINGRLTTGQVKTYLAMDAAAQAEYDLVAAKAPSASQVAQRALWLDGIHAIFILAEIRAPGYDTPAGVRTKLGI